LFDPDDGALDLALLILSSRLSSRLTRTLVYDKQFCTNVNAFQDSEEISGIFGIHRVRTQKIGSRRDGADYRRRNFAPGKGRSHNRGTEPCQEQWEFGFVSGLERIGSFVAEQLTARPESGRDRVSRTSRRSDVANQIATERIWKAIQNNGQPIG
jgi:peptidase M16-like protein